MSRRTGTTPSGSLIPLGKKGRQNIAPPAGKKARCESVFPHPQGGTVRCEQEAGHLGQHTNHSHEWPVSA